MGELKKNWNVWKWAIGAAVFIAAWAVAASLNSPGLIALGLVLAFAVPMQVGVHVYPLAERRKDAEEEKRARQAASEAWRPPGYGRQPELVWDTQSSETNAILVKISADGIYEVVSASPEKIGDPIWACNNRTLLHLRRP